MHVLVQESCGWVVEATLQPPPPADARGVEGELFGTGVAVQGDTIVVGASNSLVGISSAAGAAFVYNRTSSGNWTFVQVLTGPQWFNHGFGFRVALSSSGTLLVGDRTEAGFVMVYQAHNESLPFALREVWKAPNDPSGLGGFFPFLDHDPVVSGFGWSIDVQGDRAAVSASGAVYLWQRRRRADLLAGEDDIVTTTDLSTSYDFITTDFVQDPIPAKVPDPEFLWVHEVTLIAPLPEGLEESSPDFQHAFSSFGASVDLHGECVAVGAPLYPSHPSHTGPSTLSGGGVFVYCENSTEIWRPVAALHSCDGHNDAGFGYAVSMDSHGLAVASPGDLRIQSTYELEGHNIVTKEPAVYLFSTAALANTDALPPVDEAFSARRSNVLAGTGPGPAFSIQNAAVTARDVLTRITTPDPGPSHTSLSFASSVVLVYDAGAAERDASTIGVLVGAAESTGTNVAALPQEAALTGACVNADARAGSCVARQDGAVFGLDNAAFTGQGDFSFVCPTPLPTPSPTSSSSPTPSPTPSTTSSASVTASMSSTASPTGTATATPSSSATATSQATPSSAATPSVSALPTLQVPENWVQPRSVDPSGWGSLERGVATYLRVLVGVDLALASGSPGLATLTRPAAVALRLALRSAVQGGGVDATAIVVSDVSEGSTGRLRQLSRATSEVGVLHVTLTVVVPSNTEATLVRAHLRSSDGQDALVQQLAARMPPTFTGARLATDTVRAVQPTPTPSPAPNSSGQERTSGATTSEGGLSSATVIGICIVASLCIAVVAVVVNNAVQRRKAPTRPAIRRFPSASSMDSSMSLAGRGMRPATISARMPLELSYGGNGREVQLKAQYGFKLVSQSSGGSHDGAAARPALP